MHKDINIGTVAQEDALALSSHTDMYEADRDAVDNERRTSKSGSKNAAVEYRSLPDVDTTCGESAQHFSGTGLATVEYQQQQ